MTNDRTEFQTERTRQQAIELSQQRTQPPTEVPGYEARRFLGAGAYGEVWVAVDKNTGRQVAIKFFEHRGGVDWSLLSGEVEKLVFLSADRYVVQLLEVGWDSEPPYYVMEFVENGSLDDRIREQGRLNVSEAVDVFRDVVIGLSHAHRKGVLHCDLKPANVLLDQDNKPRLADFGQSRLTTEQSPALGTLFYMAPEQADLQAVPDARWDVYALGALLYCMVTGEPPYRSGESISEIDSAPDLVSRLEVYRHAIQDQPRPTGHRRVPGVDNRLADIIDRCLAVDPDDRFPSVGSVLEALDRRERSRNRRPLWVLGLFGPILLSLVTGVFGYRVYQRALDDAKQLATEGTLEANLFAAEGAALSVAHELDERARTLAQAVEDRRLAAEVEALINDELATKLLEKLKSPDTTPDERIESQQTFLQLTQRGPLQAEIDARLQNSRLPRVASWFVTSAEGIMLAASFENEPSNSPVGQDFSYRTYFHGQPSDFGSWNDDGKFVGQTGDHAPLDRIHLSSIFRSTATRTWKVAFSSPVKSLKTDETIGVLAMTMEVGQFVDFPHSQTQCAIVVDAREGDYRGVVLDHPAFEDILCETGKLPDEFGQETYRVDGSLIATATDDSARKNQRVFHYQDPISKHELVKEYDGEWIVGVANVKLSEFGGRDSGLRMLVQERRDNATRAVALLGKKLFQEGIAALGFVVLISAALLYFVVRMLRADGRNLALPGGLAGDASTEIHTRETLEMPPRSHRKSPRPD